MTVTGTLQSGTYKITNVASGKYVTLGDANTGSALFASGDKDSDNVKWTITKLSDNNYTIVSYVWATNAITSASPKAKDTIKGHPNSYDWQIKETGIKGQYLILPNSDDSLYWNFENSNDNTTLKLSSTGDDKDKWQFTRTVA